MRPPHLRLAISALAVSLSTSASYGMTLAPKGTKVEQTVAKKWSSWFDRVVAQLTRTGVDMFAGPVHEEITHRIYGCEGDAVTCGSGHASDYVLAGVRWNDDPPFRLLPGPGVPGSCKIQETIRFTTQPRCWYALFRGAAAESVAAQSESAAEQRSRPLLLRSHFGDLQFIHAMASRAGEPPEDTRARILGWAEFAWRVANKEIGLSADLSTVAVTKVAERFGHSDLRVQDLFTLGNVPLRRYVHEVAFGSLLHMVQDSFAKGHVERREAVQGETCAGTFGPVPGAVREFHVYGLQDGKRHGEYDTANQLAAHLISSAPDVVDVGRQILKLLDDGVEWDGARPYLECVFRLDGARGASAGAGFERSH